MTQKVLTLMDLIESTPTFSCELNCNDMESDFSFEWPSDLKLTDVGKKKFSKFFSSPVTWWITQGYGLVVEITNPDISEEEFDNFMAIMAGYCSSTEWDKCFEKVKE